MGNKLYVGGLPYSVTGGRLQELFSAHGTVKSANVIAWAASVSELASLVIFRLPPVFFLSLFRFFLFLPVRNHIYVVDQNGVFPGAHRDSISFVDRPGGG